MQFYNDLLQALFQHLGAVHKVCHAWGGEGVRKGVTVCDRGEGVQEHVTSHF